MAPKKKKVKKVEVIPAPERATGTIETMYTVEAREQYDLAMKLGLTDNEFSFVEEMFTDSFMCPTNAYLKLHPKTPREKIYPITQRILAKGGVVDYFRIRQTQIQDKRIVTLEEVLLGIKGIALRCSQSEPVRDRNGKETGEYRFEPMAALAAWKLLGQHLGEFGNKLEVTNAGGPIRVINEETMTAKEASQIYAENMQRSGYYDANSGS